MYSEGTWFGAAIVRSQDGRGEISRGNCCREIRGDKKRRNALGNIKMALLSNFFRRIPECLRGSVMKNLLFSLDLSRTSHQNRPTRCS